MTAVEALDLATCEFILTVDAEDTARAALYAAIREAVRAGMTKTEASRRSGVSRPTIDKILG